MNFLPPRFRSAVALSARFLVLTLVLVAAALPASAAQSGFGDDGLVTIDFDVLAFPDAVGRDIAVDADGQIVVSGVVGDWAALTTADQLGVARLTPSGALDVGFGVNGRAVTAFDTSTVAPNAGLAIDELGRLTLAGGAIVGGNVFALARFTASGVLDPAFGAGGHVTTAIPGSSFDWAEAVVTPAAGGSLAVGQSDQGDFEFGVVRYLADGTLDPAFAGGTVTTTFPLIPDHAEARGVTVDAEGRFVVVGTAFDGGNDPTIVAARYLPDGTLDTDFGVDGLFTLEEDRLYMGEGVAIDAEGRVVIAGARVVPGFHGRGFALLRLTDEGERDPTFGTDGLMVAGIDVGETALSGYGTDVAIDAKGRVVASGFVVIDGNGHFAVLRALDDGTLDPGFGTGGTAVTTFPGQVLSHGWGVAIDGEGRIFVGGDMRPPGEDYRFAVACYNEYGYPCRDLPYEYAAKIACGHQNDPEDLRLARGAYATTVNIHNPSVGRTRFFKKLALSTPPLEQAPGQVLPIAEDILDYDEALATDCPDLESRLFPEGFPGGYIEGFVVVQSPSSLDVTTVYSTAALDDAGAVAGHSSIDVEAIRERYQRPEQSNLSIVKTAEVGQLASTVQVDYVLEVTNSGPEDAANVLILDELEVTTGTLVAVLEALFTASHGGSWALGPVTATTASMEASIPLLPAGETAVLGMSVLVNLDLGGASPEADLVNRATVSSALDDPDLSDNDTLIVTHIP